MTHFTQNTLATTTQTLTSKRIDNINQGTYLTPSTHTTREHHTTIKTGRTQIRFNNLPTQTPGGHHTQITPHPKRPSETHTPNKKIHPQPVPPHTQPQHPKDPTQPQPLTPTNNTTRQPYPHPIPMPTKGRPTPPIPSHPTHPGPPRYPKTPFTSPRLLTYQPHIAVTHPTLPHAHLKGFVR